VYAVVAVVVTEAHLIDILDTKNFQDALYSLGRVKCELFRSEQVFEFACGTDYKSIVSVI
jgi:hypothetical protein